MVTNSGFDPIDLVFIRALFFLFTCIIAVTVTSQKVFDIDRDKVPFVAVRCICGLIAFTSMVYGVKLLPIFLTVIIVNTSPFWTALIGYLTLGDKLTFTELFCIVGCFIGVVILGLAKKLELGFNSAQELNAKEAD